MEALIDFLKQLKNNNNREWFNLHRNEYTILRANYFNLIDSIIAGISTFDQSIRQTDAPDAVFRINRDTRFSIDKTPYKTNFGAFIAPGGRKSPLAGYYFHIEPDNCFISGGIYMPPADALKKLRNEIYHRIDDFLQILNNTAFKKAFGSLADQQIKSYPKGYRKDWEYIDYLKYKHYYVMAPLDEKLLTNNNLSQYVVEHFRLMHPFVSFINNCLTDD